MKDMKIGDLCTYAPKSSIKAGEAISNGEIKTKHIKRT